MFIKVHSKQEEDWRLKGAAIATQTNPFLAQREYNNITSLSNRITATTQAWRCAYGIKGYLGIISYLAQTNANKENGTTSFINNLEIIKVFKNKDKKEGASVTDFIN